MQWDARRVVGKNARLGIFEEMMRCEDSSWLGKFGRILGVERWQLMSVGCKVLEGIGGEGLVLVRMWELERFFE